MTPEENETTKKVLQEALTEWMDKKFTTFGKVSFATLSVVAVGALVYLLLWIGWRPSV